MKIKMITLSAGPDGVLEAGKIYDLDEKKAQALIQGRFAVAVEQPAAASAPLPVEEPKPVETADVPPLTAERAVKPSPRKRKE